MINCPECGGSGYRDNGLLDKATCKVIMPTKPCRSPYCHGGKLVLEVGEHHDEGGKCGNYKPQDFTCFSCRLDDNDPDCNLYKPAYRPMTEQEVEELINRLKPTGTTQYDPMELLLSNIERGTQTFNDFPIRLKRKDDG